MYWNVLEWKSMCRINLSNLSNVMNAVEDNGGQKNQQEKSKKSNKQFTNYQHVLDLQLDHHQ